MAQLIPHTCPLVSACPEWSRIWDTWVSVLLAVGRSSLWAAALSEGDGCVQRHRFVGLRWAHPAPMSRGHLYILWKMIPVIASFLSGLCVFSLTTESSGKGSLCISRPRGSFHASPTKGQLQESRPGRVPEGVVPRTLPASRCLGRLGTQRAFTSEMDEWIHWFYS